MNVDIKKHKKSFKIYILLTILFSIIFTLTLTCLIVGFNDLTVVDILIALLILLGTITILLLPGYIIHKLLIKNDYNLSR